MPDNLSIRVSIDGASQADRALRDVEHSVERTTRGVQQMGVGTIAAGNLAAQAFAQVASSAVAMAEQAVRATAQLEHGVASISTIRPDIDTTAMFRTLNDLQTRVPQTAKQLSDSVYDIFSSLDDVSAEAATALAETFAKGATAAQTDAKTFGTAITGVLNAYKLEVGEAGRVSDVFFNTVNRGVVSGQELASSLGPVTQSAKQAGLSLEELGAAIVGVTKEGGSASQNINNLNNLLAKIQTSEAQAGLQALGVAVADSSGKLRSIFTVLAELQQKLAGMSEQARGLALQEIFPDFQARQGAQTLMSQLDAVNAALKVNQTEAGSTARAYATMSATAIEQMKLLENTLSALGTDIGVTVTPALLGIAQAALQATRDARTGFEQLQERLRQLQTDAAPTIQTFGQIADAGVQGATEIQTAWEQAWAAVRNSRPTGGAEGPSIGQGLERAAEMDRQAANNVLATMNAIWQAYQDIERTNENIRQARANMADPNWAAQHLAESLQSEMDSLVAGVIASIEAGTPAVVAAGDALWAQLIATGDTLDDRYTDNIERVIARLGELRPDLVAAGADLGAGAVEGVTEGIEAAIPSLESRAGGLLAGAGGNVGKAFADALKQGVLSPDLARELTEQSNAARALQGVYGELNSAQSAYIRVIETESNAQTALKAALDAGYISQQQYSQAIETGTTTIRQSTTAKDADRQAEQARAEALRVTEQVMRVATQAQEQFIRTASEGLPVGTRMMIEYGLATKDTQAATAALADGLGVTEQQLQVLQASGTAAMRQLKDLTAQAAAEMERFGAVTDATAAKIEAARRGQALLTAERVMPGFGPGDGADTAPAVSRGTAGGGASVGGGGSGGPSGYVLTPTLHGGTPTLVPVYNAPWPSLTDVNTPAGWTPSPGGQGLPSGLQRLAQLGDMIGRLIDSPGGMGGLPGTGGGGMADPSLYSGVPFQPPPTQNQILQAELGHWNSMVGQAQSIEEQAERIRRKAARGVPLTSQERAILRAVGSVQGMDPGALARAVEEQTDLAAAADARKQQQTGPGQHGPGVVWVEQAFTAGTGLAQRQASFGGWEDVRHVEAAMRSLAREAEEATLGWKQAAAMAQQLMQPVQSHIDALNSYSGHLQTAASTFGQVTPALQAMGNAAIAWTQTVWTYHPDTVRAMEEQQRMLDRANEMLGTERDLLGPYSQEYFDLLHRTAIGLRDVPQFHQGGLMPYDGLARLRAGERVLTPEQQRGGGTVQQTVQIAVEVSGTGRLTPGELRGLAEDLALEMTVAQRRLGAYA